MVQNDLMKLFPFDRFAQSIFREGAELEFEFSRKISALLRISSYRQIGKHQILIFISTTLTFEILFNSFWAHNRLRLWPAAAAAAQQIQYY